MTLDLKKDYLSCDGIEDAIRSLALFYGVPPEIVQTTYQRGWPKEFLADTPCKEFKHSWLPWSMGKHIGSKAMKEDVSVCFYHRSRFDGSPAWFSRGLLNNADGAQSFFQNLKKYSADSISLDKAQIVALGQIKHRDNLSKHAGPHAFFSLDEAIGAHGANFDIPEFFLDQCWNEYSEIKSHSLEICLTKLRQVVVKFKVRNSDIDEYVACLWHYLHHTRFQSYCTEERLSGYMGNGRSIPASDILELIPIS